VLTIDKHPNITGNVYTEKSEGINVHKYGVRIYIQIIKNPEIIYNNLQSLIGLQICWLQIVRLSDQ